MPDTCSRPTNEPRNREGEAPSGIDAAQISQSDAQGQHRYVILRDSVPPQWQDAARLAFDTSVAAGVQWAAPRGPGWRHALVDLDPVVQRICRLPALLATTAAFLQAPFFLSQVEGREPLPDGGWQPLHRDGAGRQSVSALVMLDPYGPDNGATRFVPPHAEPQGDEESSAHIVFGQAGDIIVFDSDILHGATCNRSGARRRSLLVSYALASDRQLQDSCRAIRNVRMDTSETFGADGRPLVIDRADPIASPRPRSAG